MMSRPKSEGTFRMSINGHELTGTKRKGKWTFRCDSWSDLELRYQYDTSVVGIVRDFTALAMANCVTFERLT